MKRIGLAALALFLAGALAGAVGEGPGATLEGEVLQVLDGQSFLMMDKTQGEVLVKLDEGTAMEAPGLPKEGWYVFVAYNGVMTRSLPPQVTADKLSWYRLEGPVREYDPEGGRLLLDTLEAGPVLVRLPEPVSLPEVPVYAVVYHDGVMALSEPGQVSAKKADLLVELRGRVSEAGDDWLLLDTENGAVRVNLGPGSLLRTDVAVGSEIRVYHRGTSTLSIPPQVFGLIILEAGAGK